ncbi:hypothetical protein [Microcoleus sp. Pol7_B1]|uniref:hypothetical protein n=1 Tax=Microcoleus sp. Pol7_B1 TaxID=2818894 RepID=UPI002FD308CE
MTFSVVQGILEPEYGSMIQIETKCWFNWLTENKSFRYESNNYAAFTVRKEKSDYWYGYRKIAGKLHKRYIGRSLEVTQEKLELVAKELDSPTKGKAHKVTQLVTRSVTDTVTHERISALEARLQLMEERLGKLRA